MKVVEDSLSLLEKHKAEWETNWNKYADAVISNLDMLKERRAAFNERDPLRLYTTVNDLYRASAKSTYVFSLRFKGREVGLIKVPSRESGNKVMLSLHQGTKGAAAKLRRDLKLNFEVDEYEWDSTVAAKFRKHLNDSKHTLKINEDQSEKTFESFIIDEMQSSKKNKFVGSLSNIQPVRLGGKCRFQMIVPISANKTDQLEYKEGNNSLGRIDVLARVVAEGAPSNKARLTVLELKKDSKESYKTALAQSITYAVCLRAMLRSEVMGNKWWRVFGYKGKLPKELTLYAVAMVPESLKPEYLKECQKLGINTLHDQIHIGNDTIKCGYAFFRIENNRVIVSDYSWKEDTWRALPD